MQARLLPRRWLTCTFLLPDNTADLWASTGHRCGSQENAPKEWLHYGTYTWTSLLHVLHWRSNKTTNPIKHHLNNHHALHVSVEEEMPQWLQSARPKRRVHSPPEAFLSLIRGASSCLQPKPAHRHDGRPAHKHSSQTQSYSFISDSRWLHFPSGSYTVDAKFCVTATVWSYRKGSGFFRNNEAQNLVEILTNVPN